MTSYLDPIKVVEFDPSSEPFLPGPFSRSSDSLHPSVRRDPAPRRIPSKTRDAPGLGQGSPGPTHGPLDHDRTLPVARRTMRDRQLRVLQIDFIDDWAKAARQDLCSIRGTWAPITRPRASFNSMPPSADQGGDKGRSGVEA